MKKIFLMLVAVTSLFVSCSKSGDDGPSITGTSWEQLRDGISIKLTFQNKVDCQIVISSSEITDAYITNYTYEYEHPDVRMYPKQTGIAELKGIINDKTMNIVNVSTGKTVYTLTKK